MTSGQMGQKLHGGHHLPTGFLVGTVVVLVIALALAWVMTRPQLLPMAPVVEQPLIGRTMVVTALRYDGVTYRNAPISVALPYQPVIGRSMTVTGLIFDGKTYRSAPVTIDPQQPVIGRNMLVTGLVFDGTTYRNATIALNPETLAQPEVGRSVTVSGLKYDGLAYRNSDIRVAAPIYPRNYTVNALVYDEELGYHTAPVKVGGR